MLQLGPMPGGNQASFRYPLHKNCSLYISNCFHCHSTHMYRWQNQQVQENGCRNGPCGVPVWSLANHSEPRIHPLDTILLWIYRMPHLTLMRDISFCHLTAAWSLSPHFSTVSFVEPPEGRWRLLQLAGGSHGHSPIKNLINNLSYLQLYSLTKKWRPSQWNRSSKTIAKNGFTKLTIWDKD